MPLGAKNANIYFCGNLAPEWTWKFGLSTIEQSTNLNCSNIFPTRASKKSFDCWKMCRPFQHVNLNWAHSKTTLFHLAQLRTFQKFLLCLCFQKFLPFFYKFDVILNLLSSSCASMFQNFCHTVFFHRYLILNLPKFGYSLIFQDNCSCWFISTPATISRPP